MISAYVYDMIIMNACIRILRSVITRTRIVINWISIMYHLPKTIRSLAVSCIVSMYFDDVKFVFIYQISQSFMMNSLLGNSLFNCLQYYLINLPIPA